MKTIFKIALRNVWRQRRRTVLTVLTMFCGFTLAAISFGLSDGSYNSIIDLFTRNQLGHIQVHRVGYLDRPSLYTTIDDYQQVGERIAGVKGVAAWSPRLYAAGLVSVGEKSTGVQIVGIDPAREDRTTGFARKITIGNNLPATPAHESLIGKGLAKILKAEIGDTIVVVSQGADGSIADDLYPIVGLVDSGNELADRSTLYLNLADAQELLVLENRVHELVIIVDRLKDVPELTNAIKAALDDPTLQVSPWQEFARAFYTAMKADQRGNWIMLGIIIIIVGVGVLNTVLMNIMERRREYGLLRAIGTPGGLIVRLVLTETAMMAIISMIIGTIVGLAVNYTLSVYGISGFEPMTYGGVEFTTMTSEINARSFYIPAITILVTALTVSIIPAVKAAHTAPARVMRMQ